MIAKHEILKNNRTYRCRNFTKQQFLKRKCHRKGNTYSSEYGENVSPQLSNASESESSTAILYMLPNKKKNTA
jgi:hypothetical protein